MYKSFLWLGKAGIIMDKGQSTKMFFIEMQIRLLLLAFVSLPFLLIGYFLLAAPIGVILSIGSGIMLVLMTLGVVVAKEDTSAAIMFVGGIITTLIFIKFVL